LSDAEKQKLWQLRHPAQTPGTDASKRKVAAVRSAVKDNSDDAESLFGDSTDEDAAKSSNRNNPALTKRKKDK
jgi:hypothetical protein